MYVRPDRGVFFPPGVFTTDVAEWVMSMDVAHGAGPHMCMSRFIAGGLPCSNDVFSSMRVSRDT